MDWSYEYERHYFFLSLPLEGDGALETFLLNAMEHETGNIFFSQQSKHFVKEIIEKKKKTPSRRMQSKILGETKSTDQSSLSRILRPGMAGPSLRRRKSIASGDSLGKVRADTDILPRLRDPQNRALRKDSSTVPRTYSLDGRRLSSHHPRRLQSPSLFRWQPKSDG